MAVAPVEDQGHGWRDPVEVSLGKRKDLERADWPDAQGGGKADPLLRGQAGEELVQEEEAVGELHAIEPSQEFFRLRQRAHHLSSPGSPTAAASFCFRRRALSSSPNRSRSGSPSA